MQRPAAYLTFSLLLAAASLAAQDRHPQRILFVGEPDTPRGRAFTSFLETKFATVRAAQRFDDLGDLSAVDVVVLDWPQQGPDSVSAWMQDPQKKAARRAPLGDRATWTTPTVLLGSAGLNLACVWEVRGSFG
jgi:hypothetical protein